MKIYLTRHSQTLWNIEKRLQGRRDSPLTLEGKDNALALKEHIKDMRFDKIYSSPILRAYNTATIIRPNDSIIKDDLLMEMNFGDFEGCYISDLLNEHEYDLLWNDPAHFTCLPHGETYEEVFIRAHQFINKLMMENNNNVLVVTHGMFFIVLLAALLGYKKEDLLLFNKQVVEGCSLTCLEYDDNCFKIIYYNDCSYLPHITHTTYSK